MANSARTPTIQTLLTGIVDYAGLFPPAKLGMKTAVENYRAYLRHDESWMLGRFVAPLSRWEEFSEVAQSSSGGANTTADPWRVTAILSGDLTADLKRVAAINESADWVAIDSVEFKANSLDDLDTVAKHKPVRVRPYAEIASKEDPNPLLERAHTHRLRAKIRTGGVTSELFPSSDDVARFIRACYRWEVGFKATAGLHHPMRGEYPLTYDENAPHGVMHGFLNVFLLAAFCYNGLGVVDAVRILNVTDPGRFQFEADTLRWDSYQLNVGELQKIRGRFATSFGSCSFEEPVADLTSMGLL